MKMSTSWFEIQRKLFFIDEAFFMAILLRCSTFFYQKKKKIMEL